MTNVTSLAPNVVESAMLGGHASRWGENTDGNNLFQFTWPSLLGVAEKLWSPAALTVGGGPGQGDREYVLGTGHRCVLVRRGLPVSAQVYAWSCDFEAGNVYPLPPISARWAPFA